MSEPTINELLNRAEELPDDTELTCSVCSLRDTCPYVDDPYNTDGDCLAEK